MKRLNEGNFSSAWGGISSLSVALPLIYTEAVARGFSLSDVVRWMAEGPAKLAGCHLHKGRIAPGYDADFVIFDTQGELVVSESRLYHRHPVSPYMGQKLRGVVKATYLRGTVVFQEGSFPGEPRGREFRRSSLSGSQEAGVGVSGATTA
jgi:allantoinase